MTTLRLIAVAFALTVATSAQAMSPAPLHQPDGMITQVRHACGAGMHYGQWSLHNYIRPPPRPPGSGHRPLKTKKPDHATHSRASKFIRTRSQLRF